MQFESHQAIVT